MTDPAIDRRRVLAVGVVSTVLISAVGLVAWTVGGDVPRGTRILGVDLGGRSRSDAERTLHAAFDGRAQEPVTVVLDGARMTIRPADVGLTLDVRLSVGAAIRAGGPMLFGTHDVPPVIHIDPARLGAALGRPPQLGRAAETIEAAWLTGRPAVLDTHT